MRGIVRVDQLRKPQGTGHPSRPAADNDHIGRHLRPLNTFNRFAEDEHLVPSPTTSWPRVHADERGSNKDLNPEFISAFIRVDPRRGSYPPVFAFFTSSISGGTMSNKLPTIA